MVRAPMEILFVTPEVEPYSGPSDAARVCRALPKALRALGHKVTVLSPLYRGIDPTAHALARRLNKIEIEVDGRPFACETYDGRTAGGVDMMFLGHEEVFREAAGFEDGDEAQVALRAGVFARAVAQLVRTREPRFELVHAHDWPGATAILQLRKDESLEQVPGVLTVHDFSRQGTFNRAHLAALGLSEDMFDGDDGVALEGRANVLKGGLLHADRVVTVSPTYAREVAAPGAAGPLQPVLAELGGLLTGILDGVETSVWNPATNP